MEFDLQLEQHEAGKNGNRVSTKFTHRDAGKLCHTETSVFT